MSNFTHRAGVQATQSDSELAMRSLIIKRKTNTIAIYCGNMRAPSSALHSELRFLFAGELQAKSPNPFRLPSVPGSPMRMGTVFLVALRLLPHCPPVYAGVSPQHCGAIHPHAVRSGRSGYHRNSLLLSLRERPWNEANEREGASSTAILAQIYYIASGHVSGLTNPIQVTTLRSP